MAKTAYDYECVARDYRKRHLLYNPDVFNQSTRKRKRKALQALGDGDGWAARLFATGPGLRNFVVTPAQLGWTEMVPWQKILDHDFMVAFKGAIKQAFPDPHWARVEVATNLALHAHVLAHQGPCFCYNGEITDLEGFLAYLNKSIFPDRDEIIGEFLVIRSEQKQIGIKRRPSTSWQHKIPSRNRWHRSG